MTSANIKEYLNAIMLTSSNLNLRIKFESVGTKKAKIIAFLT